MNEALRTQVERLKEAHTRANGGFYDECVILNEMWHNQDFLEGNSDPKNRKNFTFFSSWLVRHGVDLSGGEISTRVKVAQLITLGFGDFVRTKSQAKTTLIASHLHRCVDFEKGINAETKDVIGRVMKKIESDNIGTDEIQLTLRRAGLIPIVTRLGRKASDNGIFQVRENKLSGRGEAILQVIYTKLQEKNPDQFPNKDAVTLKAAVALARQYLDMNDVERAVNSVMAETDYDVSLVA